MTAQAGGLAMTAQEFKAHRDRLGLSQPDLADALGIHAMTVSKYERGATAVPAPTARLVRSMRRGGRLPRPAKVALRVLAALALLASPAAANDRDRWAAYVVALTEANAPPPWPACGGATLHLPEPFTLPYWQTLDAWTVYLVSDVADPTASTYTALGLPPNQPPAPRIGPGPQDIAQVVQVKALPQWCPLGCLYWVKVWPNDGGPCADAHVGFPFDHSGGQ